jgi:hypothetical protein
VIPSELDLRYDDGRSICINLLVRTWMQRHQITLTFADGPRLFSATIDPDHTLPDHNRSNNTYIPERRPPRCPP